MKNVVWMYFTVAVAISLSSCSSIPRVTTVCDSRDEKYAQWVKKDLKRYFNLDVELKDGRWVRKEYPTEEYRFDCDSVAGLLIPRMLEAGIAPLPRKGWYLLRIISFWGDYRTGLAVYSHDWLDEDDVPEIESAIAEFPTSGGFYFNGWLVELTREDYHGVAIWYDISNDRLKRIIHKYARDYNSCGGSRDW